MIYPFSYDIVYSRRKSIAIQITREAGVKVRAPYGCPRSAIEAFLSEKQQWIMTHLETARKAASVPRREFSDAERRRYVELARDIFTRKTEWFARIMGVTYGHLDHITMEDNMYNDYSDDGADMWEIGFNTSVADNLTLMAAYTTSDRDGLYDSVGDEIKTDGWFSELRYKKHDIKDPGSFAIFANYRNVGALSTIDATVDYTENIKGWTIGFDYVPIENTTIEVFYINGSQVNATTSDGAQDADIFRAQMEFYF